MIAVAGGILIAFFILSALASYGAKAAFEEEYERQLAARLAIFKIKEGDDE